MKFRQSSQQGFTLIELVLVIVILGVLAATALPRFADVQESAHQAAVSGAGGALAAAVALSHAQWIANENSDGADVDNLMGFGQEDLNMTPQGWPRGTSGTGNGAAMNGTRCVQIWNGLLQGSAPVVANSPLDGVDYVASADSDLNGANDDCLFTYQGNSSGSNIRYDADQGLVITTVN